MNKARKILKWSLLTGAVYFFLVSAAHIAGIKVPVLFIYFSLPSYAYQDKIISFLAFGWAMFLFSGFIGLKNNSLDSVKYILFSGAGAIIGLSVVNISAEVKELSSIGDSLAFWLQTLFLFIYLLWLAVFYYQAKKIL